MNLQIGVFQVDDVQFGDDTCFEHGKLTVNKSEMISALQDHAHFRTLDIEIVKPGEDTRILHVLDAVQPRCRPSGESAFPGMTGDVRPAGRGLTHVLDGVAVVVSCPREKWLGNTVHESMIEMHGAGAKYSLFSKLFNLVLVCEAVPGLADTEFGEATRLAGLKAAEFLGRTVTSLEPDAIADYSNPESIDDSLPRVAYIYLLQSQGFLRQSFVYGKDANSMLPTILHPNEVLDGAIVSSNYVIGSQRNPTYLHLTNPVISELLTQHGKTLNFVGVIVANENSLRQEKELSAVFSAKLADTLAADGVIITKEGGGNTYTDLMLTCRECEKIGIQTVIITNEVAGPHGDQPPLVDFISEANAIVSTGNMDETVQLPKVQRVVGKTEQRIPQVPEGEAFSSGLGVLYTSTNPFGVYSLSARQD